jgi:hypothetical protein
VDPAIIGAASALAGVALSQVATIFQSRAERKQKHAERLISKLEELAENLHETTFWADSLLHHLTGKNPPPTAGADTLPPVSLSAEAKRVYVLSLLYFPTMREESRKLLMSLNTLYSIAVDEHPIDNDKFKKATVDFAESKKALDNLIEAQARIIA